jgi:hypothetical protein
MRGVLVVEPGVDLSMPTNVLHVTIIKCVLEKTSVSAINISTPHFFSMVKDHIKIPKQKPVIMVIVLEKIFYKITCFWLLIVTREPINASSPPTCVIIRNIHITINVSFIISNNVEVYIFRPEHTKTTTSIISRGNTINNVRVRIGVTSDFEFLLEVQAEVFSFHEKNDVWLVGLNELFESSNCRGIPKAPAIP